MKRIPCAFLIDEPTGFATLQPANPWFAQGAGVGYRKWDGIACKIARGSEAEQAFTFFRGIALAPGEPAPLRFAQETDADDPERRGWVPVGWNDTLYAEAISDLVGARSEFKGTPKELIEPGTYELCGPGIKDNNEQFTTPTLVNHLLVPHLRTPRNLKDLILFLSSVDGEGIVWEFDGMYCQLTRKQVGLVWPPKRT